MKKIKLKVINILFFIILFLVIISVYYLVHDTVNANSQDIIIENKNYIKTDIETSFDLNKIIQENETKLVQEIVTEEMDLEYITEYRESSNVPKGEINVIEQGLDGKKEVYIRKIYENENLVSEEIIGSKVIKAAVDKIVEVGTSMATYFSELKVGEEAYITPSTLIMRQEPTKEAEKIRVLKQGEKVILQKIKEDWCQIEYDEITGWVEKDCLRGKILVKEETTKTQNENKQEVGSFARNTNLNKPSGLTEEQFEKIFENESKDINKIFKNNAKYFYLIEQQYNINGIFVAAVAIHESNWGTSKIAKDKKNLFGYGAYDGSPYESAYRFSNEAEGIDLLARVFMKYYLNPKGTKIYEGNIADGRYYNGSTIDAVGKRYASDNNWASSVYQWMCYLYGKI